MEDSKIDVAYDILKDKPGFRERIAHLAAAAIYVESGGHVINLDTERDLGLAEAIDAYTAGDEASAQYLLGEPPDMPPAVRDEA